jgi:hypothetical protein
MVDAPVDVAILDAGVGEMHLLIEVRQVVLARPVLDLFAAPIRAAVAVSITAIPLLKEALVLAFQLAIELDAKDACSTVLELGSLAEVGTVDLDVMRPFSRLVSTRIEGLALVGVNVLVALQEAATTVCERNRTLPIIDRYAFDQSLLFEMSDVTASAVEIPFRNDAKRTDRGETSCFRTVQCVVAITIVDQFSFWCAWQAQIADEYISWIVGTAIVLSTFRLPIPVLAAPVITCAHVRLKGFISPLLAVGGAANDEPLLLAILDAIIIPLACVVVARIEITRHRPSSTATCGDAIIGARRRRINSRSDRVGWSRVLTVADAEPPRGKHLTPHWPA